MANAPGNAWQGFVNWWNGAGLAWKFTIGFGAIITLVIILALIKLIYDKLTLKKNIRKEKAQEAERAAREQYEEIALKKRYSQMEEGELFGVRAIQSGFYGGVAQSAPSSPMGSRAASRAGSLYNQPVSPAGPLNASSSHLPLMHGRAASPLASPLAMPQTRSPLGLNPSAGNHTELSNGLPSPVPNAMLRDPDRPGTASSNRGMQPGRLPTPPHERQNSDKTINLDGLTPTKPQQHQQQAVPLRPSASDASTTSPPSTNHGTSHGSRGSSFTSTYSFDAGEEQQPHKPTIVQAQDAQPTLPILQPLAGSIHSGNSRTPTPAMSPAAQPGNAHAYTAMTAELPADLSKSPPRDMNFSTPFRRKSQPEAPPSNPEFGPLPAAAMNGGPQQFGGQRTQSPGPMNMGPPPRRTDSPGPRTMSPGPRNMSPAPQRNMSPAPPRTMSPAPRTMSPGPRQMGPPRPGPNPNRPRDGSLNQQRRGPPAPLDFANKQPSLPSFLQQDMNGPKTAPLHSTTSSRLMPDSAMPAGSKNNNRLTAELGEFYDSYSYERNQRQLQQQQQYQQGSQGYGFPQPPQGQGQNYDMNRMQQPPRIGGGGGGSLPGSPRMQQQQYRQGPPMDRRLI